MSEVPNFDSLTTVRDLTSADAADMATYYGYLSAGKYKEAADFLTNVSLQDATFTVDKWNALIDAIRQMQEWYKDSGVERYIANLESDSTLVGRINDSSESSNTVYSSSKITELITDSNNRTQVLTVPMSTRSEPVVNPRTGYSTTYIPYSIWAPANSTCVYSISTASGTTAEGIPLWKMHELGFAGNMSQNDSITLLFGENDSRSSYDNTLSSTVVAQVRKVSCESHDATDESEPAISVSASTANNNWYFNIIGIEVVKG